MIADAKEALRNYGETLDVRRESLRPLLPGAATVRISRVRLIYEGGTLNPTNIHDLSEQSLNETKTGSGSGDVIPMKAIETHELNKGGQPSLDFRRCVQSARRRLNKSWSPSSQSLEQYAGGWMPDIVKGKRQTQVLPLFHLEGTGGAAREKCNTGLEFFRTTVARVGACCSTSTFRHLRREWRIAIEVKPSDVLLGMWTAATNSWRWCAHGPRVTELPTPRPTA